MLRIQRSDESFFVLSFLKKWSMEKIILFFFEACRYASSLCTGELGRPSFPDWGLSLSIINTLLIVNFSVDYQVVVEDQFRS